MSIRESIEVLVERALTGNDGARSALLERLEPMLRGWFIRRAGHRDEVDDLVKNTLIRVDRGLPELRDPARLQAFALKAALFELQDLYRGRYSARESSLPEEYAPPVAEEHDAGLSIDLDRALATLSPRAQRIMQLKLMGYRYEEIAGLVESTEGAVKMQVRRALDRLRDLLAVMLWLAIRAGTMP